MNRVLHSPQDRDEIYQRFIAYVEEWRIRLVLREWAINLHLETEADATGATTSCSPKYHEASIILRLPDDIEDHWTDKEIEGQAVHELMHILVSTWDSMWQKSHKRRGLSPQMLNMLLLLEEQLCDRLEAGFMRTKYPRRKAHSSSSDGQKQVSPRRRQSPQ